MGFCARENVRYYAVDNVAIGCLKVADIFDVVSSAAYDQAGIDFWYVQGPIAKNIQALLTPHPMKELRVKLEHVIAATQLYVVSLEDDTENMKDVAMQDMRNVMSRIGKSGDCVCVQSSTLGSLEALLKSLTSPTMKIPVSRISIGAVHKKDVKHASVMLERKRKEFATILAFDVKTDIIYHLFDQFTAYMNFVNEKKRSNTSQEALFPCVIKIFSLFKQKVPIVIGVDTLNGVLDT
uniref:Translation initiation factor IF- 2 domain-containing protein n=1 Tax=Physcomitrium patens TaxID=3218 RepID=A0A2K1ICU4_PHYPA|nr:hypothetical protein PHYPA_030567 [Physcomitrium patens]